MPTVQPDIHELGRMAREDSRAFRSVSREACLSALRAYTENTRAEIRRHHEMGESGSAALRRLTELCDSIVRMVFGFALAHTANPHRLMQQIAICALGGYGRGEMSPHSDLDVSLVFDDSLDTEIETFNTLLLPFLWDLGFKAGYTLHSVTEASALAAKDPHVFTSYSQARLVHGDSVTFGRLKLKIADLEPSNREAVLAYVRRRERPELLAPEHRDLYALEPDVKESPGGLRDFHAGMWMICLTQWAVSLDDLAQSGQMKAIEHLELVEGLDFIWRIRNELHFHTNRETDRLSFPLQQHVARAFGYGSSPQAVARFMEDYYNAACRVHRFLHIAARICDQPSMGRLFEDLSPGRSKFTVYKRQLCVDPSDRHWFAENPTRLMEVIWESARRAAPLSLATAHWLHNNLHLVNDEFRANDAARRYFMAVCSRPFQAGSALREAAKTGLLDAYLPEYGAVRGMLLYKDFHSHPVDEHSLRALEALGKLSDKRTPLGAMLSRVLEQVRDPHVLVLSILLHDLGKAAGEEHIDAGVRIAETITRRIGLNAYDSERIIHLVRHHLLMSDIAFYRDTEDMDVVNGFVSRVKTDDLLRMLLLLTYADLSAVAPNVWNEWKGVLLIKLFLKAERILTGRNEEHVDSTLIQPKLDRIREIAVEFSEADIQGYLNTLSERYLLRHAPEQIVAHMECLAEARKTGLALCCVEKPELNASEIVVCTRDRHGLFAQIAGALASQQANVRNAALFTRDDGWVVDCFLVDQAIHGRPLTENEVEAISRVLRHVILDGGDIDACVESARKRLFAMSRPVAAVRTTVAFDNHASRTDTVIDLVAGDRTGLLYDIAHTLSDMGIDFNAAHIMTDVGRARDAFYVRMNGHKLEDDKLKEWVSRRLLEAISGAASHETP